MTEDRKPIIEWGEREGVPVLDIPISAFACLRADDGTFVVIYRECARDENGRRVFDDGRFVYADGGEWRVQAVSSPPPGVDVRPVAFSGLTPIEQLFFAQR